jgi:hypothetical protein
MVLSRKSVHKYLGSSEMLCWGRIEKIGWTDRLGRIEKIGWTVRLGNEEVGYERTNWMSQV